MPPETTPVQDFEKRPLWFWVIVLALLIAAGIFLVKIGHSTQIAQQPEAAQPSVGTSQEDSLEDYCAQMSSPHNKYVLTDCGTGPLRSFTISTPEGAQVLSLEGYQVIWLSDTEVLAAVSHPIELGWADTCTSGPEAGIERINLESKKTIVLKQPDTTRTYALGKLFPDGSIAYALDLAPAPLPTGEPDCSGGFTPSYWTMDQNGNTIKQISASEWR